MHKTWLRSPSYRAVVKPPGSLIVKDVGDYSEKRSGELYPASCAGSSSFFPDSKASRNPGATHCHRTELTGLCPD
ncbi:hypothetical protein Z995_05110 [Salmonella enterica subsp. arizonae serovar 18:z4,z23:- str. CVM 43480]|nr:hypothetical protein DD48_16780 [Salmonella enterica subsp. arizonae serovar 18:z4,z23:-]KTY98407.1 hypothetical protein DD91_01400 [Salmonella enterica subsp. arizonae serovar 18:z4,z23:- str. CVM N31597]PNV41131.1 hypothetical protein Z994_20860 [Salmonella enterica subsp. arizonae serovar 18:z4,z23:- str. CVM 43479]PNV43071.1 hypothetical protein Z995_05110 [Salmonella enterica subsp. arizonae serovar 18:z4,z23:- str. CVM 43480]PNV46090.1 hypothetical protein Z993_11020 [Salmonella enteri